MLCTFTEMTGETLVIRSEDIKRVEDRGENGGSLLIWLEGTERCSVTVQGTARKNMARLQQEEIEAMARVEGAQHEFRKQLQAGYPVPPVQRGKQR